jgi:hypothetical protein
MSVNSGDLRCTAAAVWANVSDSPGPHPAMPKATARKGTRRIPRRVRELLGTSLTRELAAQLMRSGELSTAKCSVVWNVDDRPSVQPVADLAVPPGDGVLPVRRIGTYQQATHLIAMYPVLRDGYSLMLTVESRLELAWLQQLDFDARVSAIYAQPFAMVWQHEAGTLIRILDLAAVVDGRLSVFEVKPAHRLSDEWTRLSLDFTARTLQTAGVPFQVCGDLSAQRRHNLSLLARYRWPNPFVGLEVEEVRAAQPRNVAEAIKIVGRSSSSTSFEGSFTGPSFSLSDVRVGVEVVKHLIASGACWVNLDEPLSLGTPLDWTGSAWRIEWAA